MIWLRDAAHQRWLFLLLCAVALVLFLMALLRLSAAGSLDDRAEAVTQRLVTTNPKPPLDEQATQTSNSSRDRTNASADRMPPNDPGRQAVGRIDQRRLFAPPPPEAFRNVQGVLGDRVLYPGGQTFGIGENAMGATVVALGPDWVKLEFEGKAIEIKFLEGGPAVQPPGNEGGGRRSFRGRSRGPGGNPGGSPGGGHSRDTAPAPAE